MPKDIEYHIGDHISSPHYGEGLILGSHLHYEKGIPVYHVFFYQDNLFRHAFAKHLTFIAPADDNSIGDAQTILLTASTYETDTGSYYQGDTVQTPIGNMILLSNAYKLPTGQQYYLTAREAGNSVHYINHMDISNKIHSATDESIKRSKQIRFDQILAPALTTE